MACFSASLGLLLAAGCGDESWQPTGVGAAQVVDEIPGDDVVIDLYRDMVVTDGADDPASPDGDVAYADSGEPRVFFEWFADGSKPPSDSLCKGATPPAFKCNYGDRTLAGCRKAVQSYLDNMYKDFNIIFTWTRPTTGKFYTEVVTHNSSWCAGIPGGAGGISPFKGGCGDYNGNTCYAFMCGSSAKSCAVIMAQEQAHLVGLEHTQSPKDVMYPSVCSSCTGFEDKENSRAQGMCGSTQNSYQLMKMRLGTWPGGDKPGPDGMPSGGGAGGASGAGGSGGGSGGSGGSGGGGSGGSGGSAGSGGAGGEGGGGDPGGMGGEGGAEEDPSSNVGGGCNAVHGRGGGTGALALLSLALIGPRRRRG